MCNPYIYRKVGNEIENYFKVREMFRVATLFEFNSSCARRQNVRELVNFFFSTFIVKNCEKVKSQIAQIWLN